MSKRVRYGPRQAGFTLIELVIVLGIIGAILALVLNGISGSKKSTDKNQTTLRVTQIQQQLLRFQSDMGRYPTTQEGLEILFTSPGGAKWNGPYGDRSDIGQDAWNQPFTYELTPKGPRITSQGPPDASTPMVYVNGKLQDDPPATTGAGGG